MLGRSFSGRVRSAKIVLIDTVRTARRSKRTGTFASTSARAGHWALGMINVMIAEDLTPDVGRGMIACARHRAMMSLHRVLISASASSREIRWNCPPSLVRCAALATTAEQGCNDARQSPFNFTQKPPPCHRVVRIAAHLDRLAVLDVVQKGPGIGTILRASTH